MRQIWIALIFCPLNCNLWGGDHSAVSNKGTYRVEWQVASHQEVPLNKSFDLDITVRRIADSQPADVKVGVTAIMPAHNHGMNADPEMVRQQVGHWLARGINLFMPGEWKFLFDLSNGTTNEDAVFTIKLAEDCEPDSSGITADEARKYLSLFAYESNKVDTTNIYANDPLAARLGEALFYDPRLSGTGQISCASCHQPSQNWTDGRARALGVSETRRNTPSLWNVAHRRWLFWDGRAVTLWSQALIPIEAPAEMGGNRSAIVQLISHDPTLRALYLAAFGANPTRKSTNKTFANLGKAIAAFEATLSARPSRFDQLLSCLNVSNPEACRQLKPAELNGLRLFTGRAGCSNCHHGPDLTDEEFHDIMLPRDGGGGRNAGLAEAQLADAQKHTFGPSGKFSDDPNSKISLLVKETKTRPNLEYAYRTPSLRNVMLTAPYMHNGIYTDLRAVLQHYSTLSDAPAAAERDPLVHPLNLTPDEISALSKFLLTLGTNQASDLNLHTFSRR